MSENTAVATVSALAEVDYDLTTVEGLEIFAEKVREITVRHQNEGRALAVEQGRAMIAAKRLDLIGKGKAYETDADYAERALGMSAVNAIRVRRLALAADLGVDDETLAIVSDVYSSGDLGKALADPKATAAKVAKVAKAAKAAKAAKVAKAKSAKPSKPSKPAGKQTAADRRKAKVSEAVDLLAKVRDLLEGETLTQTQVATVESAVREIGKVIHTGKTAPAKRSA